MDIKKFSNDLVNERIDRLGWMKQYSCTSISAKESLDFAVQLTLEYIEQMLTAYKNKSYQDFWKEVKSEVEKL